MKTITNEQVITLIKKASKSKELQGEGRTDATVNVNADQLISSLRELIKLREFFEAQETIYT